MSPWSQWAHSPAGMHMSLTSLVYSPCGVHLQCKCKMLTLIYMPDIRREKWQIIAFPSTRSHPKNPNYEDGCFKLNCLSCQQSYRVFLKCEVQVKHAGTSDEEVVLENETTLLFTCMFNTEIFIIFSWIIYLKYKSCYHSTNFVKRDSFYC